MPQKVELKRLPHMDTSDLRYIIAHLSHYLSYAKLCAEVRERAKVQSPQPIPDLALWETEFESRN